MFFFYIYIYINDFDFNIVFKIIFSKIPNETNFRYFAKLKIENNFTKVNKMPP